MANEADKERAALLKEIRSMEEQIKAIRSENASISSEIATDKVKALEAAVKEKAINDGNLQGARAFQKLDATRAMMAQAIADGTLDQFDHMSKIGDLMKDAQKLGAEEYQLLRDGVKELILKKKEMQNVCTLLI